VNSALRECGRFNCAADVERKREQPVLDVGARKSGEGIRKKTLSSCDFGDAVVIEFVRSIHIEAPCSINIYAIAVNVDRLASNPKVRKLEVGGDSLERGWLCSGRTVVIETY
jgi:hypothetical protein